MKKRCLGDLGSLCLLLAAYLLLLGLAIPCAYAQEYTLTLNYQNGTISKVPDKPSYASGESVKVTFTPNDGYTFKFWSGDATGRTNPLTVVMDKNKTINVNSDLKYTLSLSGNSCVITKNPDYTTYDYAEVVTITATPNIGYMFDKWTGTLTSYTDPLIITMDGNKIFAAACKTIINDFSINSSTRRNTCVYLSVPTPDNAQTDITYALKELLIDNQPRDPKKIRDFSFNILKGLLIWYPRPSFLGIYKITIEATNKQNQKVTTVLNITVPTPPICSGTDAFCNFIKNEAIDPQGYIGICYRNADGWHATASTTWSGQVDSFTESWALQTYVGFPGEVTFTNSSTAYTGLGGDNNTVGMDQNDATTLFNNLINPNTPVFGFYPGHWSDGRFGVVSPDFGVEGHFGKFIYTYSSVGSSGSELSAVIAYLKTAGAFRKEVFSLLKSKGTLMSMIIMLDRLTRVDKDEQRYMSLETNPSFFKSVDTRALDMVKAANAMTINTIPPMPRIRLTAWPDPGLNGISYFESSSSNTERTIAFKTPMAIATLYRELHQLTKTFEIDAIECFSPNGAPITEYHWVVTKGDPQKIRIIPVYPDSSRVKIEIDYHAEAPVPNRTNVYSNLVEVALFVRNANGQLSPPAFFTSYSFRNEVRIFENGRLKEVSYNSNAVPYQYPTSTKVSNSKSWLKDVYKYDNQGILLGWDRYMTTSSVVNYTTDGKIITKDNQGNPTAENNVQYNYDSNTRKLKIVTVDTALPKIEISPIEQTANPGEAKTFSVKLINRDSSTAAAASFQLQSMIPPEWSSSFSQNYLTLSPGQVGAVNWQVNIPANIRLGTYSLLIKIIGGSINHNCLVLAKITVVEKSAPKPPILYGDVDGDGYVKIQDAALTAKIVVKLVNPTPNNLLAADVDNEPGVTIKDAALIAKKVVGLITEFSAEQK